MANFFFQVKFDTHIQICYHLIKVHVIKAAVVCLKLKLLASISALITSYDN